jgi:hypothetical protein
MTVLSESVYLLDASGREGEGWKNYLHHHCAQTGFENHPVS